MQAGSHSSKIWRAFVRGKIAGKGKAYDSFVLPPVEKAGYKCGMIPVESGIMPLSFLSLLFCAPIPLEPGGREAVPYLLACSIATATATVAPTMGLLPIPRKPIISTWAGTEDEPANCASECILPIVSVMP